MVFFSAVEFKDNKNFFGLLFSHDYSDYIINFIGYFIGLMLFRHGVSKILDFVRNISILPYKIIGSRLGIDVIEVNDPSLVFKVLSNSSIKGEFLERRIATPAWYPILSIESVDGQTWENLRKNYDSLIKYLPSVSDLTDIMKQEVDNNLKIYSSNNNFDQKFTSPDVVKLFAKVLWRWIFSEDDVPSDYIQILENASWEWRKEIAVKGKGDVSAKNKFMKLVIDKLKSSERYNSIPNMNWDEPECYSVIMQPFLISPMINFSDIAVSMINESNPMKAIMKHHPFPILERTIEYDIKDTDIKAGDQVIMFHSAIAAKEEEENPGKSNWMAFGCGPRKCQGSQYAMPLLKELSRLRDGLVSIGGNKVYRPDINHKYSGRNNDSTLSISETLYFIKTLIHVTFFDDDKNEKVLTPC